MQTDAAPPPAALSGCLITLEGVEGSGKTTQARLVAEWLRDSGAAVTTAREPGGTALGERLRMVLLDPALPALRAETEVLLFAAARSQAVAEVIAPALARGEVVVCDRFVASSLVYQGDGLGADPGFIRAVNEWIGLGIHPALTLVLDVPVEVGVARRGAAQRADRIEARPPAYHEAVRQGYLRLAREEPERFAVLDARADPATVASEVRARVAVTLRAHGWIPAGA